MLLRSCSTPILGSLASSFSESPNNNIHGETNHTNKHLCTAMYEKQHKLSFNHTGPLNFCSSSCNSSPMSPSIDGHKGFRRAQSDGNLLGMVNASYNHGNQVCNAPNPSKRIPISRKMLEPIPSSSTSNTKTRYDEEEEEEPDVCETQSQVQDQQKGLLGLKVVEEVVATKSNLFHVQTAVGFENGKQMIEGMHIARGLGLDVCGNGGFGGRDGGGCNLTSFGGDGGGGGDGYKVEEYYKRMLEENPGNPLFLTNYAQFLYQYKGDLKGADEYYSRAILADPNDGEVLSEYAKLVWELNHDRDRAASYHERAVKASPGDSHVKAAYAGFLWETEEDDDTCDGMRQPQWLHGHPGAMAPAPG